MVDRPGPRLSADTEALTAPVDAALAATVRQQTWQTLLADAESLAAEPYSQRARPLIQAQLNPRRRLHPNWPEEWYVHVPGTAVTWRPKAAVAAGYPRPEIHAFPSAAEAERDAQAVWRRYWSADRHRRLGPDSVIEVAVAAEFTVRWGDPADEAALAAWRPPEGLPPTVVVRTRDVPASVIGAPQPRRVEQPPTPFLWLDEEPDRERWLQEDDAARRHPARPRAAAPVDPWSQPEAQHWRRVTHAVLRAAQALPDRTTALRMRAAVLDAVETVYQADRPTAPVSHPRHFVRALDQAVALGHHIAPSLDPLLRTWADAGQLLRADDVGLFLHGTWPAAALADPSSALAGHFLDRSTVYVHRLPAGGFVLWHGADTGQERPRLLDADPTVYPSLASVRDAADQLGVHYVSLQQHPAVPDAWAAAVRARRGPAAEAAITRMLTPPPPRAPSAPPPAAPVVEPVTPGGTLHLSPWDPGHVFWWRESPTGTAHWVTPTADGGWVDAAPTARPTPTPAPRGFAAAVRDAQAVDPRVTPADLPPYLARQCVAAGVFPTALPSRRDCLWHIADLPFAGCAVAWTRPWSADQLRHLPTQHGLTPAVARTLTDPETHQVYAFANADQLGARLAAVGAVALPPSRVVPAEVARDWYHSVQRRDLLQHPQRVRDPFRVLRKLPPPAQRVLIETLQPDLRPAAWAAVADLSPRETAAFWQRPAQEVSRLYRRAETALAFTLDRHRDQPVAALQPAPTL